MINIPIKFTGFGTALPSQIIENEYFEQLHKVEKGSIAEHLGVISRRHVSTETMPELAVAALKNALNYAQIEAEDIDLLLSASVSIQYILPNNASVIAKHLGAKKHFPCMDVNQSCLSFLSALEMASALLQTGNYRRIAIVSSETPSKILNTNNLETHSLFGDAAAAVIVERSGDPNKGIVKSLFRTYPDGWNLSLVPGGGLAKHPLHQTLQPEDHTFQMQNQRILLYSLKQMKSFFTEFMSNGVAWEDIDIAVPHQGSKAGMGFFTHEFGLGEKVMRNLEHRGNCVAASIPLALCEGIENGKIKAGQRVLLAGTAAGISLGGILVQL